MSNSFFQKLSKKLRYGLVPLMVRDRLLRWNIDISPYHWSLEDDPANPPPGIPGDFEGFTFGFFGPEDMDAIGPRPSYRNIPVEELKERLAKGHLCYGAKYKGEAVAFNWVDLEATNNRMHPARMKPNEAYLYDTYTMKPFRGRNISPVLRVKTYEALKKMGRDTFYSLHISLNKSTNRFKSKINAKVLKSGIYIGLFKKFRWNITVRDHTK